MKAIKKIKLVMDTVVFAVCGTTIIELVVNRRINLAILLAMAILLMIISIKSIVRYIQDDIQEKKERQSQI